MKKKMVLKYILILCLCVIALLIYKLYNKEKDFFEDIIILSMWSNNNSNHKYEILNQKPLQIDIFTTIYNTNNKKIAPGSKGNFIISMDIKKDIQFDLKIEEKTSKPQNLYFVLDNKKYFNIQSMESIIKEKLIDNGKVKVDWNWPYFESDIHDKQDTIDGENSHTYIIEIEAIIDDIEGRNI